MASLRLSIALMLALPGLAGLGGCTGMPNSGDVIRVDGGAGFQNAREFTQSGIRHVGRGEMKLAEQSFKMAIRADETHGPAHNNLGRVYFHRGDLKRSAEAFDWAMKFMPDRPEPVNNLGLTHESAGKLDEAIDLYQTAHDLSPEDPEYLANLVRAKIRRGDRGTGVRSELQNLRFVENRADWIDWIDRHLAMLDDKSE